MPALQIRLLGTLHLVWGDASLTTVNTPRLQSLLAYLLLHRDAPQPRRQVAFSLWPDLPEARAYANLRKLFLQLREALPAGFLGADRQTLQWQPDAPYTLDVAEFEAYAAAPADWEQAVEAYGGDLLPDCYDEWIVPERERLRLLYLETLERLAQQKEVEQDNDAALRYGQRLLQADPLREEVHRQLMRLHLAQGERAAALRAFQRCATILQQELGVEPGPATRELYERMVHPEPGEPQPASGLPSLAAILPLVGRDREWAQLQAAWRTAVAGYPHLALLTGEAGIGKTRLAEELVLGLNRQGVAVAVAHCYSAQGVLPYAPVVEWLRARPLSRLDRVWLTEVARLLPELLVRHPGLPAPGPLTEAWQRQRLHEALARAVLGGGAPLLLWIEDLQWCDRDTLEWLRYLLRFDTRARLLLLGTYRLEEIPGDQPLAGLLASLRQSRQLAELALGPLGQAETAQLAAHAAGQELDAAAAADLYRETEGNPLFVVEMVRAGRAGPDPRALPAHVQAAIAARLARLSPPAAELAGVAATIGREFTFAVLQQASGAEEEAVVRGLDELWRQRVVREQGVASYDFSHGKIREAAYASLSAARRRLLHRRVAEALEAVHAHDLDSISAAAAAHYEQAGLPERAVPCYRRAAQAAMRVYASDKAIAFLSRAIELTPEAAFAERYDLLLARHEVYDLRSEREAQTANLDTMVQLAQALNDRLRLAEAWRRQAWMFAQTSRFDEAEQRAQAALAVAQQLDDLSGQSNALIAWGMAAYLRGDMPRAAPYLQEAVRLAQAAGNAQSEADARRALLNIRAKTGEHEAARAEIEALLLLHQQANDLASYAQNLCALAALLLNQGQGKEAEDACRRALETCRAIGHRYSEAYASLLLGMALGRQGQIGLALEQYTQAIDICDAIQEQRFAARAQTALAGLYIRFMGDYDAAVQSAQVGMALGRQVGSRVLESACLAQLGHALLHKGDVGPARACLDAALAAQLAADDRWEEEVTRELLAELELEQGRAPAALEHIDIAQALCRETGLGSSIALVLATRGQILLALNRLPEALAATEEAMALLRPDAGRAYLISFQYARVLLALNRPGPARAALEQAYRLLSQVLATLSPAQRQMSLERVPEHQALAAAFLNIHLLSNV